MHEGRPSPQETWDALFSDFYLKVQESLQPRDEARTQALAAARLAQCPEGGEVLDVPCGFGRHTVPLGHAGYRVTGVDRSEPLLAEARRRAAQEPGGPEPRFLRADYRELPFDDASFDAALNLFTSIGYLGDEEDTHVLAEIARVLRPGGRLIVETMHRDRLVRIHREQDWRLLGGGRLLLMQRTFDVETGTGQETQTLIEPGGQRESRSFTVRVYTATKLAAMLVQAGFAKVSCLGDLDGGPLSTDTRLVLVARR